MACRLIIGEGGQAFENGVVVRVERTHAEQRGREWEEPVGLAACAKRHKPRHPHAKQGFGVLTPTAICLTGETRAAKRAHKRADLGVKIGRV